MKINIIENTTIKFGSEQSSEITDPTKKFTLNKGEVLEVNWYKDMGDHYLFELKNPKFGRSNWYVWKNHSKLDSVILDVPYFSQRDNTIRPHQTCNVTCCAMVIEYFHPGTVKKYKGQLEDNLTTWCVNKWGKDSIYSHNTLVDTLREWGVNSKFSTETPVEEIKRNISMGNPCIYSGKFTKGGHIIVIIGYNNKGFIVNDPYGEWFSTGYNSNKTNGGKLIYSYELFEKVSYSGKSKGWAHLCSKVK